MTETWQNRWPPAIDETLLLGASCTECKNGKPDWGFLALYPFKSTFLSFTGHEEQCFPFPCPTFSMNCILNISLVMNSRDCS